MEPDHKKSSDSKANSSMVWFLMILLVAMAIAMIMILNQSHTTISFRDFQRLVEKTAKTTDPENADSGSAGIEVQEPGENGRKLRYSNPTGLVVGAQTITGRVQMKVLAGTGSDKDEKTVEFSVNKVHSDTLDAELKSMLDNAKIGWDYERGPSFWDRYGILFFTMGLIALLFYLMMRRLGGAGGPMQFGRSRGRLYAEEDLAISFDDVAGIDEAVEEVKEVVDFLRMPEKYQKLGGRIPRGVLLVGPPGTGKTLLAKAIAGEAGVPFFSLSGSDFVEMFVGVGAARVRDMFQQAEAKAPCIIFIDELDALGKTRSGSVVGGHDEREQTLNALLVEMDGFASNSGVIVMAATNRPETLDQALMRPGRFDRHVLVDRPDVRGREAILKVHVKNVKLDPTVDLNHVASISPGFAGADLANLVNEAALLAAREEKTSVGMNEFNEGVERVTAGLEKKQRVMNVEEKQRVAYHESGHALVAYSLPNTDPVHKVSIIPRGLAALGYTMQRPASERYLMTRKELESQLQILLAGTIAEEIVFKDISTGAQNDLERATDIARAMVTQYGMSRLGRVNYKEDRSNPFLAGSTSDLGGRTYSEATARDIDEEVKRIIDHAITEVRQTLHDRQQALEALAQRLIEIESVDHAELKRIVDECSTGPVMVPGTALQESTIKDPVIRSKSEDGDRAAQQ